MAEYQHTPTSAGETTQRFIEFVLMHAQNAAFMLGQIPHPQTGKPEVNLDMAQLLIDQLAMIAEKTAGNLNSDEQRILHGTLSQLQMAFVEAVRESERDGLAEDEEAALVPSAPVTYPMAAAPAAVTPPHPTADPEPKKADEGAPEPGSRKKFVKSYGS